MGGLKDPATAVAAGENHTCVLTSLGGVQCWGYNLDNQLGNASIAAASSRPVPVAGLAFGRGGH